MRIQSLLLAAAVATAAAAASTPAAAPLPRGVPPSAAALYAGPAFDCADGAIRGLPIAAVNDDYCDCADGSDEPGSSACPSGRFYCANVGHRPRTLNASAVDDGVCDCCDGSDEPAGACPDTCAAAGAAALAAAESRLAAVKAGLAARAKGVARARRERAAWARAVARAEGEVTAAEAAVDAARPAKDAADAEEEAERKEREAAKEEEVKVETPAPAPVDDAPPPPPPPPADTADDDDPEAAGRRIAAQWTHDKEAALGDEDPVEAAAANAAAAADAAAHTLTARLLAWMRRGLASIARRASAPAESPRDAARRAFREAEAAAAAARDARDAARSRAALDLGPGAAFLPLHGACVAATVDKYTYRVCPFDRAEQEDGAGGHPVSLGSWAGWGAEASDDAAPASDGGDGALPPAAYTTMRFADGAHCWNGPPRSLTVTLVCGASDALTGVAEPSRCEYVATLATPAACGDADEEAAAAEVEAARRAAAGHDEL